MLTANTNLREDTDDFATSTLELGSSGTSCKEAIIPARNICSSISWASDIGVDPSAIQGGTGSNHGRWFKTEGSLVGGQLEEAVWFVGIVGERDPDL